MAFTKVNPKKAFKMVKVGSTWQVTINDQIVAVADKPRKPRALTNRLNGALRSIGDGNVIYVTNLVAGLREWLDAASADDSYARPPIRVFE